MEPRNQGNDPAAYLGAVEDYLETDTPAPNDVALAIVRSRTLAAAPFLPEFSQLLHNELAEYEAVGRPDAAQLDRRRRIVAAVEALTIRELVIVYATEMERIALESHGRADALKNPDARDRWLDTAKYHEAAAAHARRALRSELWV